MMSLPEQEARALVAAFQLLCDLSSGAEKRIPSATRQRAREVLRHYPLAADLQWLASVEDCTCNQPKPTARPAHPATMIGRGNAHPE